jgi:hypothetical protein
MLSKCVKVVDMFMVKMFHPFKEGVPKMLSN